MKTQLTLEQLQKIYVESKPYQVRGVNQDTVQQYTDLMTGDPEAGIKPVIFPLMEIAEYTQDEKTGFMLIDGAQRLHAMMNVHGEKGMKTSITVNVEKMTFIEALKKGLSANILGRGLTLSATDRNKRIMLLSGEPYKLKTREIAPLVSLNHVSVSNIIKQMKEKGVAQGDPSLQKGKNKKGPKAGKPLTAFMPRAACTAATKLILTFDHVETVAEMVKFEIKNCADKDLIVKAYLKLSNQAKMFSEIVNKTKVDDEGNIVEETK